MFEVKLIAVDVWGWLIPAVFIVIYILNHILTAAKAGGGGQQPRDQQQRRGVPAGERPLRPQPAQQPGSQSQLNTEIEQFLKRANERRMEKARGEAPARPAPKGPLVVPPQVAAERAVDVEPLERHDFDAVDASVRQHLGNRGFEQRAAHLGDDLGRPDEEMEQHLKEVFQHRLGKLNREESTDVNAPRDLKGPAAQADSQAAAKAMAGLLANQQNIRQAILLKEILERPIDRW